MHYSMVKPCCSNFRVITAIFSGVPIFRICTVHAFISWHLLLQAIHKDISCETVLFRSTEHWQTNRYFFSLDVLRVIKPHRVPGGLHWTKDFKYLVIKPSCQNTGVHYKVLMCHCNHTLHSALSWIACS